MIDENEIERGWDCEWSEEEIEYLKSLNKYVPICLNSFKASEDITFSCTRKLGHTGIHVAHGVDYKICAVWD